MSATSCTLLQTGVHCPLKGAGESKGNVFVAAVKASKHLSSELQQNESLRRAYEELLERVNILSKGELATLYIHEYNSHRSRKHQAKERHIEFTQVLSDFRDWLVHLGPWPGEGFTVDRVDNSRGYIRNNLRWAPKWKQTENRKVTKWHRLADGRHVTTKMLARDMNESYGTTYKKLQRGHQPDELLRSLPTGLAGWRFPIACTKELEYQYGRRSKRRQSRLDWYLEHLRNLHASETRIDAVGNLLEMIASAESDRDHFLDSERKASRDYVDVLIDLIAPPPKSVAPRAIVALDVGPVVPQLPQIEIAQDPRKKSMSRDEMNACLVALGEGQYANYSEDDRIVEGEQTKFECYP